MAMIIAESRGRPSGVRASEPEASVGASLGFRQVMARGGAVTCRLPVAVALDGEGALTVTTALIRFRSHRDTRRALEILFG